MSTVYQGKAGNITPPAALTITGVVNASPAIITVSGTLPAAFLSGVTVDITGTQGATGVNGVWVATVTGASTFTIPNGLIPGVWTSGGSVQPLYLQAQTIPADGDVRSAASVNVPLESLADEIAYLTTAVGGLKIYQYFFNELSAGAFANIGNCPGGVAGLSWGDWLGTIAGLMPFTAGGVNVIAGDEVEVSIVGTFASTSPANSNRVMLGIWTANYAPGASPVFASTTMPGVSVEVQTSVAIEVPFFIKAHVLMTVSGLFDFKLRFMPNSATTTLNDFFLRNGVSVEAKVLRSAAIPQ
jgi:hypothetical protein